MSLELPSTDSNEVVAYVINLDRRPDRWESVQEQWKNFSNRPDKLFRVKGVDTGSLVGCGQSHQLCIDHAKRWQMPWILILEDDVVFHAQSRKLWADQMTALERHGICDIFRSGLSACNNPSKLKPPLYQFRDASGLFFTLYFASSYDTVLRWQPEDGHLDRWLSFQPGLTNLTAAPFVASTLDGQSDIRNRQVEDSNVIKRTEAQLLNHETQVARGRPPAAVPFLQVRPKPIGAVQPNRSLTQVRSQKGSMTLGPAIRASDGRILRQLQGPI